METTAKYYKKTKMGKKRAIQRHSSEGRTLKGYFLPAWQLNVATGTVQIQRNATCRCIYMMLNTYNSHSVVCNIRLDNHSQVSRSEKHLLTALSQNTCIPILLTRKGCMNKQKDPRLVNHSNGGESKQAKTKLIFLSCLKV